MLYHLLSHLDHHNIRQIVLPIPNSCDKTHGSNNCRSLNQIKLIGRDTACKFLIDTNDTLFVMIKKNNRHNLQMFIGVYGERAGTRHGLGIHRAEAIGDLDFQGGILRRSLYLEHVVVGTGRERSRGVLVQPLGRVGNQVQRIHLGFPGNREGRTALCHFHLPGRVPVPDIDVHLIGR